MSELPEGRAIVYCEGAFNTTYGKTAHGLVRFTYRYKVISVVDSRYAGQDAGEVLDGSPINIPVCATVKDAWQRSRDENMPATHLVIGIAPDGGRLSAAARQHVKDAISLGLNVDSGLHDYLSEDPEFISLTEKHHVTLRDVRKPPPKKDLHFFSGKIEQVDALKLAVLGTDSAVGKRTTAWLLVKVLKSMGYRAEMVGTGQTAWLQGVRFGFIMDTMINDFIAGEIEHAVWRAWKEGNAEIIVIEGQGSMMNPAYPGGYELLAAGRPELVVLQHAPARKDYDGFPGYPIHPLHRQINALETVCGKPVVAVTINHENLSPEKISVTCEAIETIVGIPAFDVLRDGAENLAKVIERYMHMRKGGALRR